MAMMSLRQPGDLFEIEAAEFRRPRRNALETAEMVSVGTRNLR